MEVIYIKSKLNYCYKILELGKVKAVNLLVQHFIVGDINIAILDDTPHSNEYLNILRENNFISMINEETRVSGGSCSCIDHIFLRTDECYEVFQPLLLICTITDHYPVILQFTVTDTQSATSKKDSRQKYKTYINYNNLRGKLKNHNWS
nr:unnamed protein product [Callosobruchus analis]